METVILESHKGSFCVYTPKFCQEGYCSGCEIYLKKLSPKKLVDSHVDVILQQLASSLS
jgi:hypothetical protein